MSAKAIIIQKPAGFCLFNEHGKLAAISPSEFEVIRRAIRYGYRLVNNGSAIGQKIQAKIQQ